MESIYPNWLKNLLIPPPPPEKIPPIDFNTNQIFNTTFLVIAPVTFLFATLYSFYTYVLLILILIYAQY